MSHFQPLSDKGFYTIQDYKFLANVRPANRKKLCAVTELPLGPHNAYRLEIYNYHQGKKARRVWVSEAGMAMLKMSGRDPISGASQLDLANLYNNKRLPL